MKTDERTLEKHLKALANRRRLAIVKTLKSRKTASVGQVAEDIKLSFKATSKHLSILYAAGFVEKEQTSLTVNYRLAQKLPAPIPAILSVL